MSYQTYSLAERLNFFSESQTIEMSKKARALKAEGKDVINLSLGEPDFVTPEHIRDAAKRALDEGCTFYTPVAGTAELRQAIAKKLLEDNGLNYAPENIVVTTGAKQAVANLILSLVNPGDEVIIFTPYWTTYPEIVKLAEGVPVFVEAGVESNYKVTPSQLENAITSKTKVVLYSSPCNPTGTSYTKDELEAFAHVIDRHTDVFVISDEIYEYINFTGKHESIASFESIKDRVAVINGFSKGFAMTGWRIGYLAAPLPVAKACEKIQGQFTSATSSISQKAALTALTSDKSPTYEMAKAYKRRRDLVISLAAEIPGMRTNVPEGAFYIFPDISAYFGKTDGRRTITSANDLCIYLLEEALVATVPGEAFGMPDCMRISYAASDEQLKQAFERIKQALAALL